MNGDKIKKLAKIRQGGFTLIEMMVAVSIFAIVVTIALGAFLNVSEIQNKAMAVRAVNDNLNFAVETMMREIRTGRNYSVSGSSIFNFTSARGCLVEYTLNTTTSQIERKETIGAVGCVNTGAMPITSTDVEVDEFEFFLNGEGVGDGLQPIVSIIVGGTSGIKEKLKSRLNLQVTVSQRDLDS